MPLGLVTLVHTMVLLSSPGGPACIDRKALAETWLHTASALCAPTSTDSPFLPLVGPPSKLKYHQHNHDV